MTEEPLYRNGVMYDRLHQGFCEDLDFYAEESRRAGGTVLELACGTGRLTIPIARAGVEIVGLDRSPGMLNRAREKAPDLTWISGDARVFDLGRRFALILMPFNSMQHLHDYQDVLKLLARVRAHLQPGGRFIFDLFNPNVALLARDPGEIRQAFDGSEFEVLESSFYDDASQCVHTTWRFPSAVEQLVLRCYFPQEMSGLLDRAGFEVLMKYGDFDRTPFASGAPKQIFVCRSRS
ncbi:class I SAM-dependent methyltransferase [bacterium]|nr:class I SAM-dependent methyltransferase [bacterium]